MNLANGIPLSIWYDWHEDGQDPKEGEHHFGTVGYAYHAGADPVFEPKPAYRAARALTHTLAGFSFVRRLAAGGAEDYALLFRNGEDLALAVWTTASAPHPVRLEAGPGSYRVTSMLGEKSAPLKIEGGVLEIAASDAPQYVTLGANAKLAAAPAAALLTVALEPANDALQVRVENPSETAFDGTLTLVETEGLQLKTPAQPISLAAGEAEKTFRFPLAQPLGQTFKAGAQFKSKENVINSPGASLYARGG